MPLRGWKKQRFQPCNFVQIRVFKAETAVIWLKCLNSAAVPAYMQVEFEIPEEWEQGYGHQVDA